MKKIYRRLNRAFHLMRRRGLMARANFMCCDNCAGTAMTNNAVKMIDDGKRTKDEIKGCCYYHEQDNEIVDSYLGRKNGVWRSFLDDGKFPEDNALHLRYGPMDSTEHGEIGLSTVDVGVIVCECLQEAMVGYSWDGNPTTTILVDVVSACEQWDADRELAKGHNRPRLTGAM